MRKPIVASVDRIERGKSGSRASSAVYRSSAGMSSFLDVVPASNLLLALAASEVVENGGDHHARPPSPIRSPSANSKGSHSKAFAVIAENALGQPSLSFVCHSRRA